MSSDTGAMVQLPKYRCHKVVHALKIAKVQWHGNSTLIELVPEDGRYAPLLRSLDWVQSRKADSAPGYWVRYEDGYESWSPVDAFEKGYTLID